MFLRFYFLFLCLISSYSYPVKAADFVDAGPPFINIKKIANESLENVSAIMQDKMGFTWVVNDSGLLRYDGNTYKKFPGLAQFTSPNIEYVVEGQSGRIWIPTLDKGLALFETHTEKLTFIDPFKNFGLESKQDTKPAPIAELSYKAGFLYFVSNNQVLKVNEESLIVSKRYTIPVTDGEAIIRMLVTSQGDIWCSTNPGNGVIRLTENGATRYSHQPNISNSISSAFVTSIYEDRQNRIWFGGISGLDLFLPESETFVNYTPIDLTAVANQNKGALTNFVLTISEDNEGALWLALLRNGIIKFQPENKVFKHFPHLKGVPSTLLSNEMYDGAVFDSQQNLWVSTDKGLSKLPSNNREITQWINIDQDNCKALVMHKAIQGTLFSCNKVLFELSNNKINHLKSFDEKIVSIYQTAKNTIWLGTVGGGIYRFNPIDNASKHYEFTSDINSRMGVNLIYQLRTDVSGNLYGIAGKHTQSKGSGLIRYNPTLDNFFNFKTELELGDWVDVDKNRMVLISSFSNQEEKLFWFNKNSQEIEKIAIITGNVLAAVKWRQKLWVSTQEQGLITIDTQTGQWQKVASDTNISITGLYVDVNNDHLLLSSNNHLYKLTSAASPKILETCITCPFVLESLSIDDPKSGQLFRGNGVAIDNNQLLLSAENKVISLPMSDTATSITTSKLLLTDYRLMGESVLPTKNELNELSSQKIEQEKSIVIPPESTFFSFSFSKVGATQPNLVQYLYKMEGLNQNWLKADAAHAQANYSLLPAGNYAFRVRASDDNGYWQGNIASLLVNVTVLPPWWQTWWAYSLYIICIILLFRWFYLTKLAEQEHQAAAELASAKEHLFANISHEFRTPLTLILGPAKVIKTANNDVNIQHNVSLIERNALRLLTMVEQLLQLAHVKEKQKKPIASRHVATICHFVIQSFDVIAKDKNITLKLQSTIDSAWWVSGEQDALETILYNLLSNAFKYTDNGGIVSLSVTAKERWLEFVVADNGCGISKDNQAIIFNRFSRVENSNNYVPGVGIGLALVKELVEALGGKISVSSAINKGAIFTFTLPKVQANTLELATNQTLDKSTQQKLQLATEQLSSTINTKQAENLTNDTPESSSIAASDIESTVKPSVLVVDDNQEMRMFIRYQLAHDYQVIEAENGQQAIEKALSYSPDIIISDVMMPVMDGFELLKALRQEIAISHIPVILLTAKDDQQSKLTALSNLSDDYITKPFDGNELQIRLKNILGIRVILQKRFANINFQPPMDNEAVEIEQKIMTTDLSPIEQLFLQRFDETIEQNYANPELNLSTVASCLAMSERQLQRKLKAVSGINFSELLRDYRLSKSCALLKQQEKIAATAEQIGFSSSSYFVRCFKAKYGKTPNEFRKVNSL